MFNQDTIDRIEELKHTTKTTIDELQTNLCPMIKDVYLNYQFEYWYDGYKYNIWEEDTHLYAVNEIPYCYDNNIKNTVFKGKLDELVEQDIVWPFLLFVNGAVIKWSNITIIHDYDYSYLRIDSIVPNESLYAKLVYFPVPHGLIRYGEDNDYLLDPNTKGLYFGTDGLLLNSPEFTDLSVRLEILDDDIYFKRINIYEYEDDYIVFDGLEDGFVPTINNIVLFNSDGTIYDKDNSEKIEDKFNGAYSTFYIKNKFDSEPTQAVLLYNTSHSKSSSHIYIRQEDLDKDAVLATLKSIPDEDMADPEASNMWNDAISKVINPFDFKFSYERSYEDNLNVGANTISKYDYSLWNKIYIENCPIKSFAYTGADYKKLADDQGYVHFSRRHSDLIEDVAMMFVNSKLYANSIDISYVNNTINLPIFGILDDDHVEIILFTKCNNNILDINVPDSNTPVYIHPEYNLEDCYIMSEDCSELSYPDTPESPEHRRQYICEIESYEVDENSNYKISFKNPDYYGTDLKIVPKNQFRYYRFTQREGQYKFILPTIFNYCHDISRYMIFVNGKRIDKERYTITIMNQYRPFDKLILYLSTILDENDYVDVFYLPEELKEQYKADNLDLRGCVFLQEPMNYPKLYSLSKYTTMVFVNGYKINPFDIKDLSMNGLIINTDLHNIYNVTILEYMDGCRDVAEFLYGVNTGANSLKGDTNYPISEDKDLHDIVGTAAKDNETETDLPLGYIEDEEITLDVPLADEWKRIINALKDKYPGDTGYEGLESIYGELPELSEEDIEKNYKDDYAPLRAILYDIVVDHYFARHDATTGMPFIYDFEVQEWYPNDYNPEGDLPDGYIYYVNQHDDTFYSAPDDSLYVSYYSDLDHIQVKLITLYPDHDKLLDYYFTDEYATADDVVEGMKFVEVTD